MSNAFSSPPSGVTSLAPGVAPRLELDCTDPVVQRAVDGILRATETVSSAEPLAGAIHRARELLGASSDPAPLLAWWSSRTPGHVRSEMRYRWELTHRIGVPMPPYAGPPASWRACRTGDQPRLAREPFDFEAQLLTPVILTENMELLAQLALEGDASAIALLDEVTPIVRREFANHVQMAAASEDLFALWCLVRQPRALTRLHPIAVAIAASYAAECDGPVLGTRHPWHEKPLVSASAQLATSLVTLGSDLELVAMLGDYVRTSQTDDGAWHDGDSDPDVQTTLAAADLVARIDPSFDPAATRAFFARKQDADGLWRALGPDAPWLTLQIAAFLDASRRPFADRFRWPHRALAMRDHKTGLPFFAYFVELVSLFETLPGLAAATTEVAFIDLIGFRDFNNRFGQSAGDDVLQFVASHLEQIPASRTIRDGGDEFLVIGAPTRGDLASAMDTFRRTWPEHFRARFGEDVPPVGPRILVGRAPGRELRRAREELGRG
ncbi:MAG: GGDEF domain-containing protein, partial [Myxococcota bacterium]|nr:GGDEF domain-containing protein [Myxococcota bacterium]